MQVYFQVQIQFQVLNQIAKLIRERGWKSDPSSLLSHGATNSLHALSALEIRFGKMGEARVGMHTGVDRSPNWCGPKPENISLKALEPELAGIQCAWSPNWPEPNSLIAVAEPNWRVLAMALRVVGAARVLAMALRVVPALVRGSAPAHKL